MKAFSIAASLLISSVGAVHASAALGVEDAPLPAHWGQPRTDIKRGNPLFMPAPRQAGLWRPNVVEPLAVPDGFVPADTSITVQINGANATLRLRPKRLQDVDPVVMVQLADGSLQRHHPLPSNLYTGEVEGFPGSTVSAAFRKGKLNAHITLRPGQFWEIQPLSDLTTGADPTLHLGFSGTNPMPVPPARCGVADGPLAPLSPAMAAVPSAAPSTDAAGAQRRMVISPPPAARSAQAAMARTATMPPIPFAPVETDASPSAGGPAGPGMWAQGIGDSRLAIDVDCYLYDNYNNVNDTLDFVNQVIDNTNSRYIENFNFRHLVTYILVRTSCAGDPYQTANPDDADQMLAAITNVVWTSTNPVPRDQVILFTGRNLDGTRVGLANPQTACRTGGQCLIEADWTAAIQSRYWVARHELGHTWGAAHICGDGADYCSIMCAALDAFSCAAINTNFMNESVVAINNYRALSYVNCAVHSGGTWYLDSTSPYAFPTGMPNHPFQSFPTAYYGVTPGGTLQIRGFGTAASYSAVGLPGRMDRPLTITRDPAGDFVRITR